MKILFLLISSLFLNCSSLFAQTKEVKPIDYSVLAMDYMQAYSAWDIDKMGTFFTDSVHFIDPTSVEAFNNGSDITGKDSVVNYLKKVFKEKPEFVRFDVKTHFVSTNYVVINSLFESILPAAWLRPDDKKEKVFVSIPVVTILHFKGDKVDEHIDYADYKTYMKQLRLQIKK